MKKFVIVALLMIPVFVFGQTSGKLTGTITDSKSGDPLPGVNILLKGTYYGASTDFNGEYSVNGITPGNYTVQVSLIGFKTVEYTGIQIEANKILRIDVKMEETVLTLDQDVVVVGEKPLVDVEETQSIRTISRKDIEIATVENIKDVVSQQAGVVQSDNEIHIRGGRTYENAFLLDGVSVQDPLAGTGFGLQLSSNAIEEVEVITGGFNAEYGQATSGIVNVRTREGAESFSGALSYRRDNFGNKDSRHIFNTDIVEANLSGPEPFTKYVLPALGIKLPGELTFFGSFYMGISDGITQGYYKPTAKQLFSSTFYGTRFAPRAENNWFWMGKMTYKITPTMKLVYSFNQSININQDSPTLQSNL